MQWFLDLTIRTKLIGGFVVVSIITAVVGFIGIMDIKKMDHQDDVLFKNGTVPLGYLVEISTNFQKVCVLTRDVILENEQSGIESEAQHIVSTRDTIKKYIDLYQQCLRTDAEKKELESLNEARKSYGEGLDYLLTLARSNKDTDAFKYLGGELKKRADEEQKIIFALTEERVAVAQNICDGNTELAGSAINLMAVFISLGVLIALGLGFVIARVISRPIQLLDQAATKVAAGDVTQTVTNNAKDETGHLTASFNIMVGNIKKTLDEVRIAGDEARTAMHKAKNLQAESEAQGHYLSRSVETILQQINRFAEGYLVIHLESERTDDDIALLYQGFSTAAHNICTMVVQVSEAVETTASATAQIAASIEEMSTGAAQQSEQASNVAAAVLEMTSNIIQSNKAMSLAVQKANLAEERAKSGGDVVVQTIEGMNKIAEVVQKSATTVMELGKSSEEIGEIVQVINDIADQTNLLALNAAIEAARAGEQGRGFAVVADEVRKLAERTAEATKQIGSMIKRIQRETSGAVSAMKLGTDEVENGKLLADKAGNSLKEIITISNDVQTIISQLAGASAEQETTSEDISRNIQNISNVAIETNRAIEQVAHATDDLARLTMILQELLAKFNTEQLTSSTDQRIDGHSHRQLVSPRTAQR